MKKVLLIMTAIASIAGCSKADPEVPEPQDGKTVVVYFSKTVPDGVDATTGATPTTAYKGQTLGATQYLAQQIVDMTGFDVQRITVADDHYPVEYNALADVAKNERDNNVHPPLTSTHDLSRYQNIIIGMPVWWYTMPMPMFSFLDNVDLSGKNVYIFTTHAGSGLNNNPSRVKEVEPGANVSSDGLAVSGGSVASADNTLKDWLVRLGFTVE